MSKISCDVIRDLLPLYVEQVVSEDTAELVKEHLASCERCRKELEDMQRPVALPDFQAAQRDDREAIEKLRSTLVKKRLIQSVISVLVVLTLVGGMILGYLYYGRERSFEAICPISGEITYAALRIATDEEIRLSQEQVGELLARMEQLHYKKLTMADRMSTDENYATLRMTADGHIYELMFSSSRGGCVLVNDVEKGGKAPLYRMVSDGRELERYLTDLQPK